MVRSRAGVEQYVTQSSTRERQKLRPPLKKEIVAGISDQRSVLLMHQLDVRQIPLVVTHDTPLRPSRRHVGPC